MVKSLIRSITLLSLLFVFHLFPYQVLANSEDQPEAIELFAKNQDEIIELYEDESATQILHSFQHGASANAVLMSKGEQYSLIRLTIDTEPEKRIIEGYVQNDYIIPVNEAEEIDPRSENEELKTQNELNQTTSLDNNLLNEESNLEKEVKSLEEAKNNEDISELKNKESTNQITADPVAETVQLRGVALNKHTNVYANTSINSNVLKSYNEGHILLFEPFDSNWFKATVYVKGIKYSGYIHSNDVDVINEQNEQLNGFAVRYVGVYESPTRNANVLKAYKQGHALIYRTFSSQWYEATVYVNGKALTGYIHASDVSSEKPTNNANNNSLRGIALKGTTSVYSEPAKATKVLKSYKQGHILFYRSYNSEWHEATVYVNNKAYTGFIHSNDVDTATASPNNLNGIGTVNPTHVYSQASKQSKVLKSYAQGHILKYRTFTKNWFEATVYVNGKAHTGYIHSNDVDTSVAKPSNLKGIGLKSPTMVFSAASLRSQTLKSYNRGHILKYRTFTKNWFEATVYVNGKARTGYIHKDHVEEISKERQETIKGLASKSPTKVYERTATNSKVLKSYRFGHNLIYRTFSKNWFEATVYVNGKAHTGYIHKNDVSNINGKIIVLDAGHGGNDPGATGNGIVEKDLTLDITHLTKKKLEDAGFTVILTRESDVYVSLPERTQIANRSNGDIFISIHGNSHDNPNASGTETYWDSQFERNESERLATVLQKHVNAAMNSNNRGVKQAKFVVVRETEIPSALIETGFISNPSDAAKLKQDVYKERIAAAILSGIIEYF